MQQAGPNKHPCAILFHVLTLLVQVSDYISTFVSTAEGAVRDIPAEQVSVPSVTELSREAFVAGVSSTTAVRDQIKVCLCPEALQEAARMTGVLLVASYHEELNASLVCFLTVAAGPPPTKQLQRSMGKPARLLSDTAHILVGLSAAAQRLCVVCCDVLCWCSSICCHQQGLKRRMKKHRWVEFNRSSVLRAPCVTCDMSHICLIHCLVSGARCRAGERISKGDSGRHSQLPTATIIDATENSTP